MGEVMKGEYFYQVAVEESDIIGIAEDLHPDDHKELLAGGFIQQGEKRINCIRRCVANSVVTYAIRCSATDLVMAIGGYTESGNCWFLSSDWLMELWPQERKDFRDLLMRNLMATLKLFPVLRNAAWAKNTQHLRLIQSCGGRLGDSGYMPNGEEFVYFEFRREDYPQLN